MDSSPSAAWRPSIRLVVISFLGLYFELTLIRWIPTQVRLLAYFTNFVLIAALLGLGLGMLLATRRVRLAPVFPFGLLVLTLVVLLLARTNFVLPIVSGGWFYFINLQGMQILAYVVLVLFFLILVATFILIGQEVGRAIALFQNPLVAYSLNLLGSLLGVLGFAAVSAAGVVPTVWFVLGCAAFAFYVAVSVRITWRYAAALLPLLVVVSSVYIDEQNHPASTSVYWSPYYQIEVAPIVTSGVHVGYNIRVNKDNHQYALDLSGRLADIPTVEARRQLYMLPYRFIHPKHILVFGAGSGNDVSVALREAPGATIDAVEIDPTIAHFGKVLHPNRPYNSPRVHLHINDARSFLQRTRERYDLIIFGLLDSHRVFSQMSSVRLDNFVYTREDMETVRQRLAPHGMAALTFSVPEQFIANRIFTLLNRVFGRPPLVYQGNSLTYGTMYLTGNRHLTPLSGIPTIHRTQFQHNVLGTGKWTWRYTAAQGWLPPSDFSSSGPQLSDDWPYLYLSDRSVPANYLTVLLLTVIVSLLLVFLLVPRIDVRSRENWNFFLLGAGFALQETKGITDTALLFGSTWITNIIVISAILAVAFLATCAVAVRPNISLPVVYLALGATLLFNYTVSLRGLLAHDFATQALVSGIRVAFPLFFSGIIFAGWFKQSRQTSAALGANLMGAVVGGLTEYSSLALGLNQLYLLAILYYLLSFAVATGLSLRPNRIVGPALSAE